MSTKDYSKTIRFNSEIKSIEKVNPMFSSATIRVLYTGFNRNGSYFSKDSVLKSIDSIYNIPLVGEYIEYADNFGDHGTSLEIKGNEIKLISSTKPYGVIPESAEIYWEDVTETDGTINEYLVVDGAYLWSGRYEEIDTMLEQKFGQSMEIEIVNGNFAVIDGIETFNVDEFIFSALCILGVDKDGEGHVEPAFESASITAYSLDKEDFKRQFTQMMSELKFSLKEGGNTEMTAKDNKEPQDTELAANTAADFATGAITSEDVSTTTVTDSGNPEDSFETTDEVDDTKVESDLTDSESTVEEPEGVAEESDDNSEEDKPVDESKDKTEEEDTVDFEVEYNALKENYQTLESDYEIAKGQLAELQSYKRSREEDDIRNKFSGKLSDEEFTQVFEDMKDSPLESIEKELFALIGQKNFSIQKKDSSTDVNRVIISQRKDVETSPYGSIFED